ncbi:MAG: MBL fold metallo-hydrolase [Bacteroidia bacterium]|jgi:glyoxylase-like metal-dependent hydrolase (beta-lactamase superfamily II)|nr:MBL fold metallo-hydrolase [Bacteroidia bacterium]
MKLHTINTGFFKLDGGAMFGVVPKTMWQKLNPPDENNMCTWAMRCLLIEDGNKLILVDNGIGNKQDEKFFGHYYLHGDDTLEKSIRALGFGLDDITDVFLTHLHFDHCGGSVRRTKDGNGFESNFSKATFWSNENHWKWATEPNAREKASFLKENILPIQESGQLKFTNDGADLFPNVKVKYMNGHTDGMMLPHIQYKGRTIVFVADLLPSAAHLPIPFVMAYDTRPLITLNEKAAFIKEAQEKDYILFFEHDPQNECCDLKMTEKGVRPNNFFKLSEIV